MANPSSLISQGMIHYLNILMILQAAGEKRFTKHKQSCLKLKGQESCSDGLTKFDFS